MGILGAFYNLVLLRLTLWADHSRLMPRPLRVLTPFIAAGALLYVAPQVLVGFGLDTLQLERLPPPLLGLFALLALKMGFSWISFASGVSGGLLMPFTTCRTTPAPSPALVCAASVFCAVLAAFWATSRALEFICSTAAAVSPSRADCRSAPWRACRT